MLLSRVKSYTDSIGSRLPKDWAMYRVGNTCEDLCVFCEEPHKHIPVMVIPGKLLEAAYESGTHCCTDCERSIKSSLYGYDPGWVEMVGNRVAFLKRVELLLEGKFDITVILHYSHNTRNYHPYVDKKLPNGVHYSKTCYLCKESSVPYIIVNTPVLDIPVLSGGDVCICERCISAVKELFKHVGSMESLVKKLAVNAVCDLCGQDYLVTTSMSSRRYQAYDGYYCSECASRKIFDHDSPVRYSILNPYEGVTDMIPWAYPFQCKYTGVIFSLDLYARGMYNINYPVLHPTPCLPELLFKNNRPINILKYSTFKEPELFIFVYLASLGEKLKGNEIAVRAYSAVKRTVIAEFSTASVDNTYFEDLAGLLETLYTTIQ